MACFLMLFRQSTGDASATGSAVISPDSSWSLSVLRVVCVCCRTSCTLSAERLPVSTRLRVKSLAISSKVCVIWFHPFDLKCVYHDVWLDNTIFIILRRDTRHKSLLSLCGSTLIAMKKARKGKGREW